MKYRKQLRLPSWHWILVESQEPIFNNVVNGIAIIEPKESIMIYASIQILLTINQITQNWELKEIDKINHPKLSKSTYLSTHCVHWKQYKDLNTFIIYLSINNRRI